MHILSDLHDGDLPADARCQAWPIVPSLPSDAAMDLAEALAKLMRQFAKEGRCSAWRVQIAADGAAAVVAWASLPLSGCSHDKLNQVLTHHEVKHQVRILTAPPMLLLSANGPLAVDRQGLRAGLAEGRISAQTLVVPLRTQAWATWMAGPVPLAQSYLAALLPART
jgi:hypothetical protein